jgi:hypothetical protein
MKKPDWLPNWRNEAEYSTPETTTAQQWAWEFLRRNTAYQDAYVELIDLLKKDDRKINQLATEVICSFYGQKQFSETSRSPFEFMLYAHNLLPIMHKKKENYPWMPEVCWRLVANYNLRYPLDPSMPYNFDAFIENDALPIIETDNLIMNPRQIPEDRRLTITIDLRDSSTDQFNYINGLLSAYGKTQKNRKSEYRNYLRILDGRASDTKWNIISKGIGINSRSAYDKAVKNAEDFRETGFYKLSHSKRIPGKGNRIKQGQADGKVFFDINESAPSMRQSIANNNCVSSNNVEIFIKPLTPPQKN